MSLSLVSKYNWALSRYESLKDELVIAKRNEDEAMAKDVTEAMGFVKEKLDCYRSEVMAAGYL